MYRYQCQCVPQDPAEEEQQSSMWCQKGVDVLLEMPSPSMFLLGKNWVLAPFSQKIILFAGQISGRESAETHVLGFHQLFWRNDSNLKETLTLRSKSSQTYQIYISS